MRFKNLLVCLLVSLFALAAATVIQTDNAQGTGRAVSGDGHRAYFTFNATKVSHNSSSHISGTFDLLVPGADANHSTRVHVDPVTTMNVVTNTARFGGDGILRIQDGTNLHYYHGSVVVYAISNRHPGEAGDPDRIAVHFVPATAGDPTFGFEGNVTDGDIAVTTNLSY